MAKFTKKITNLLNQQVPEFVLNDHPKFLEFVQTYYRFMESAEATLANIELTDGIQLETETAQTNSLVLDASRLDTDRTQLDSGDKILLEDSVYGKFQRGEIVTGQSSNATATILSEDLINNRIFISAQDKFIQDEVIIGSISTARATLSNYKPNPVNNIQDLLNFRDPDKAISNFLTKFRNEFLNTLPETLDAEVSKRKLIKNIRSVYRAKGTQRGHEVFFRFLFNLDSDIIYPREQMLRVSDGKFDTKKILRAIGTVGETTDLIGRTITGLTSGATAIVENVFKFQIGINEVSEFILNDDTITGTFVTSEEIRGTVTDTFDSFIKAVVTGIPDIVSITNDGGLLTPNDAITFSGGGQSAILQVDNVGTGSLTEVLVASGGSGYAIGDSVAFTNTNTGGGSAVAKVSVVNGGITTENGTVGASLTDHIVLEDETVRGDVYTGDKILQESGTGSEDITDIRIINEGSGYTSLPTATVTSSGGSGVVIIPYGTEVGRLLNTKKIETGAGYEASPSPTMVLPSSIIVKDVSGTFIIGETVTGVDSGSTSITATVVSFSNSILKVSSASGQFAENTTITGAGGASATVLKNDFATATVTVNSIIDTSGEFIGEDGFLSESTMKIQDSLYYQDFSYVIRVGRSINDWRDSFKKTMHTAGFYFTGQVDITSQVNNQIRSFTGVNSGLEFDPGVDLVINTLFSTIFGRRLGTVDDGTTLRDQRVGVDPDFDTSTTEHFTANTRDLTLKRDISLRFRVGFNPISIRGSLNRYGYGYCGPRMNTINKYAINMMSGSGGRAQTSNIGGAADSTVTVAISPMQMHNWADFRITGTYNTSLDGEIVQFQDITTNNLKTNLALPTEITER